VLPFASFNLNVAFARGDLSGLIFVTSTGSLGKGSLAMLSITPLSAEVDKPIDF